ncbi:uncharacterized protein TNCV_1420601 [Trichonephila clavipes]|nr:uncharacterized protein TNCV_1420601 [Trichonephila clavipes]
MEGWNYAKDEKNSDYYPKNISGEEIGFEVDGKEFISDQLLAKVQTNNIIGKLYREGKSYRDYVTNRKSTRLSRAARQKYSTFSYVPGEYYLTQGEQVFAIKEVKPYYAKDKDKNEFYPVVNDEEKVIHFVYANDASGNEKYPHDTQENQIAFKAQGAKGWIYATNKNKNAFYPTDNTRKDIVLGDYIYKNDGSFKYPLNKEGHPVYETDDATNDEVYFVKNGGFINWGVDRKGNQRYAKKENGDELYPANREFACDHSGSPQYARTKDVLLNRYAKTSNGEEIYPIQITNQTPRRYKEVILKEKYVTTDMQEVKYPLDEYGNEYTLEMPIQIAGKETDYFPQGYPITNDNWVIVPEVNGKKIILDQLLPKVQANNIINKLHREFKNNPDYVTNVKSMRQSRAARQGKNGKEVFTKFTKESPWEMESSFQPKTIQWYGRVAGRVSSQRVSNRSIESENCVDTFFTTPLEIQKSTTRGLQESKPKLSAGTPGGEQKIRHSDSDS